MTEDSESGRGGLRFARQGDGTLVVGLTGAWLLRARRAPVTDVEREAAAHPTRALAFDASELEDWDSSLLNFLLGVTALAEAKQIAVDRGGLPRGVIGLLRLAEAVPEKSGARGAEARKPWLARVGDATTRAAVGARDFLTFMGEATVAFWRMLRFQARFQRSDVWLFIQNTGAEALPIVTLISFLVGLILAFVGSVQLKQFGATIYVANLVAIGMAREMGAIMTGIIMAGRTGAAFAAQLGTMKVNQEIDALRTIGLDPVEYLVLPRIIALVLMMPLLCVYADVVGILGGAVVGIGLLDLSPSLYLQQTIKYATLTQFATGIGKSAVFGVLVALSGCLRGIQSGNSASAVGDAATSAVVTAIVLIVVTDGLFAVVFNVLGI